MLVQPKSSDGQRIANFYYRKEVKTMKYEAPELTALNAINAIQSGRFTLPKSPSSTNDGILPAPVKNEGTSSYEDWE